MSKCELRSSDCVLWSKDVSKKSVHVSVTKSVGDRIITVLEDDFKKDIVRLRIDGKDVTETRHNVEAFKTATRRIIASVKGMGSIKPLVGWIKLYLGRDHMAVGPCGHGNVTFRISDIQDMEQLNNFENSIIACIDPSREYDQKRDEMELEWADED